MFVGREALAKDEMHVSYRGKTFSANNTSVYHKLVKQVYILAKYIMGEYNIVQLDLLYIQITHIFSSRKWKSANCALSQQTLFGPKDLLGHKCM